MNVHFFINETERDNFMRSHSEWDAAPIDETNVSTDWIDDFLNAGTSNSAYDCHHWLGFVNHMPVSVTTEGNMATFETLTHSANLDAYDTANELQAWFEENDDDDNGLNAVIFYDDSTETIYVSFYWGEED